MEQGSSQHIDNIIQSLALGLAMGAAAHLSEDASRGLFPLIAGAVAFGLSFTFLELARGLTLRNATQISAGGTPWLILLFGIASLSAAAAVTDSRWRWEAPRLYEWIEITGFILIALCVIGQRFYVRELAPTTVAFFGCLGAAGVGAQSGKFAANCHWISGWHCVFCSSTDCTFQDCSSAQSFRQSRVGQRPPGCPS
jgi:hypothetical protein